MGQILEAHEAEGLIKTLGRQTPALTPEQIAGFIAWANEARVASALVDLALEGRVLVMPGEGGEPRFAARPTC